MVESVKVYNNTLSSHFVNQNIWLEGNDYNIFEIVNLLGFTMMSETGKSINQVLV